MTAVEPPAFNWRALLSLAVIAGLMGVAIAAIVTTTSTRIADQRMAARLERLTELLPPGSYDNALHQDILVVNAPGQFQSEAPVTAYRASLAGEVVSVIFALTAHDGYNGDIDLLIAIHVDGSLQAVRVVRHQETPGLGDQVELRKSDWLKQFDQLSVSGLSHQDWQSRKYGGRFDNLTGATITASAVLRTVERTVEYFQQQRDKLLVAPAHRAVNQS